MTNNNLAETEGKFMVISIKNRENLGKNMKTISPANDTSKGGQNVDDEIELWQELDGKGSLLERYLLSGWLDKKYVVDMTYLQPYSAKERFLAGRRFYHDYLCWSKGMLAAKNYEAPKVDGGRMDYYHWMERPQTEPFRKALRSLSKATLPVLYKIVIEERDILAPKNLTERERCYFNHEVKVMLCRGLDELSTHYKR